MSEFVTFKLSKKLKEKGYPQHICDDGYITEKDDKYDIGDKEMIWIIPDYLPYIAAPTISQVLKWLRELLEIDILPNIVISYCDNLNRIRSYSCNIYSPRLNKPIETEYFESYEEASLAGIEYVLDNFDKL